VPARSGTTRLEDAPYGVVFGWHSANSPIWVPTLIAASAFAGGNAVLSRPSRRVGSTTARVLEALTYRWPLGAVQVVTAPPDEAEALIAAPGIGAVVAHASTATCRRHMARLSAAYEAGATLRPYIPEASGNDAMIVLDGADMDRAADAAALGGFANAGQLCMAAKRIIVERSARDEFVPRLLEAVGALVTGPADDERTDVAPIAPAALTRAISDLDEALAAGGKVLTGGESPEVGLSPTVVLLPGSALHVRLWRDESFAPLRGLAVADDPRHAVALANDTPFGLGAAVFGPHEKAMTVATALKGARITVNEGPLYQDPHLVVGGIGDSGLAGARPKVEQLVFARRTHVAARG
jgi:acyl-CoA reductase-like NAD-dependent aldehyde dehydrogenase